MDTARYSLDPPPPTKRSDHTAWRAALDNAHAQLEHQYNRCVLRASWPQAAGKTMGSGGALLQPASVPACVICPPRWTPLR